MKLSDILSLLLLLPRKETVSSSDLVSLRKPRERDSEREMGGSSLSGLQEHLKLAREYALEGVYDTSIIFFDGAIAQINK